jgi:hypothetical protein
MRSRSCRSRIHTRPRRYCGHAPSRLPTDRRHHLSSSESAIVFIGRNSGGNWVAQEQNGPYGGLFFNRAQAIKYARFENGRHPEAIVVELAREIELDAGGKLLALTANLPALLTRSRATKISTIPD